MEREETPQQQCGSVANSSDVIRCNVCSASRVRLYLEEGTEILHCTFQALGYKIQILERTPRCT